MVIIPEMPLGSGVVRCLLNSGGRQGEGGVFYSLLSESISVSSKDVCRVKR